MSNASVDLPEPLTPVMTLNWPRNLHAQVLQVVLAGVDDFYGVFGLARCIAQARFFDSTAGASGSRSGPGGTGRSRCSAAPVCEVGCSRTSSACPRHQARLPASPPSGPRSMSQSLARITSRLCSMTTMRVPGVQQFVEGAHQLGDVVEVQAGGGLVEQNSVPVCAPV